MLPHPTILQFEFGGECVMYCKKGWTLKGNSQTRASCNLDGHWNIPRAYCGLTNQTPVKVRLSFVSDFYVKPISQTDIL